jgi:CxxC motif-containing protein (DUF1111 family)
MQFSLLMRFMDAPEPDPNPSPSAQRGKQVFSNVGCNLCHTPQMQTAPAMPDEFRTTPLWGVGQRLFFLHDGRTSDLLAAIKVHASAATRTIPASEANAVIDNFFRLPVPSQQAVLDFLRSL